MPAKYVLHTSPAAPRLRPVGKLGIVDWREDCSSCHNCVKRACIYRLYRDEADTLRDEVGYLDYIYQCKGCLSCVQNCTKNLLTRVVNPEYLRLGDDYYTPDIILATWFQAESGRIPVSGSGYGGPFSGSGFDSMWTDMSEIVRPTRDGIHGREYINTSVDIGGKLPHLAFAGDQLVDTPPPLMETPLPVIFDVIPEHWRRGPVLAAVVAAAAEIGTLAVLGDGQMPAVADDQQRHVVPLLTTPAAAAAFAARASQPDEIEPPTCEVAGAGQRADVLPRTGRFSSLVMIPDGPDVMALQAALKQGDPERILAIRVEASPAVAARAVELTRGGAEVIHLVFDRHGREAVASDGAARAASLPVSSTLADKQPVPPTLADKQAAAPGAASDGVARAASLPVSCTLADKQPVPPTLADKQAAAPTLADKQPAAPGAANGEARHVRDVLRDVHTTLVKQGIRDRVTLIASGGIAQAEHVAKAIICGADLVAVDLPLLVALECRLCGECERGQLCPIALEDIDLDYGVHRIVNLIGAWHQQLIEVLGAMGIREVRRLRGETGRCMFFEDLERETFGRLFGKRKARAPGAAAI